MTGAGNYSEPLAINIRSRCLTLHTVLGCILLIRYLNSLYKMIIINFTVWKWCTWVALCIHVTYCYACSNQTSQAVVSASEMTIFNLHTGKCIEQCCLKAVTSWCTNLHRSIVTVNHSTVCRSGKSVTATCTSGSSALCGIYTITYCSDNSHCVGLH